MRKTLEIMLTVHWVDVLCQKWQPEQQPGDSGGNSRSENCSTHCAPNCASHRTLGFANG